MATTTMLDYPHGITFEQVWTAIQELRESQKESDRKILELREEINRITQKADEKYLTNIGTYSQAEKTFDDEADQWIEEINESIFKKYECNFGNLSDYLVRPFIERRFRKLGYNFTLSSQQRSFSDPENNNNYAVIDIMLESTDFVIAIAVNEKIDEARVDKHIKAMEILRHVADKRQDKRKYHGAIAVAESNEIIREFVWQNGMFFIEQSGKTMKLDMPEGFVPRKW